MFVLKITLNQTLFTYHGLLGSTLLYWLSCLFLPFSGLFLSFPQTDLCLKLFCRGKEAKAKTSTKTKQELLKWKDVKSTQKGL